MQKSVHTLTAAVLSAALLASCAAQPTPAESAVSPSSSSAVSSAASQTSGMVFIDALGHTVELESWERVISLYGSFAETWTLAGGELVGVTQDAVEERGLTFNSSVTLVGNVKTPSSEEILALDPDFVILSADIEGHLALDELLTVAGVPHAYYRVDSFGDYLAMLRQFCDMTGREDLYQKYGANQQTSIEGILTAAESWDGPRPTVLLLRAYSTGVKAKGNDIFAGQLLTDLGAVNIVNQYESLLEDLSMEEIIAADPEYILVVPMGASEDAAAAYLAEHFESNPAWAGLSAVQSGDYRFLPKDLFHYKPNARWAESYATLAQLLYPGIQLPIAALQ
ncbi:MAG: ABC transporter substrate-binding protein [Faecalibacterium sp.]